MTKMRVGLWGAAVAFSLLVAGCASPIDISPPATSVPSISADPSPHPTEVSLARLDAIAEKMKHALERERADSVSEIQLSEWSGGATFVTGGVWKTWELPFNLPEDVSESRPLPSRPGGISVSEAVDMTKRLWSRCPTGDYKVYHSVVSRTATLTKLLCSRSQTAFLNGEEMPMLDDGWAHENLEIVWRELRLIAGGAEVKSMGLVHGKGAQVSLSYDGTGCAVSWIRMWNASEGIVASARCGVVDESPNGPIDLDRFTSSRVAAAIESGTKALGVTDASKVVVGLENTPKNSGKDLPRNYRVVVRFESRSTTIDANDW